MWLSSSSWLLHRRSQAANHCNTYSTHIASCLIGLDCIKSKVIGSHEVVYRLCYAKLCLYFFISLFPPFSPSPCSTLLLFHYSTSASIILFIGFRCTPACLSFSLADISSSPILVASASTLALSRSSSDLTCPSVATSNISLSNP